MRLILILLMVLGSSVALANFGNFHAIGVDDSATYRNKGLCQKGESEKAGFQGCFSISECPPDECSIKEVEVRDNEKPPTRTVTHEQACEDEQSCLDLIGQEDFCPSEEHNTFWGDRDEDESLEAWCIETTFPTKMVEKLRPDQDKIDAKQAAEQAQRQEREAKEQALGVIRTELQDCAGVLEGSVQPPRLQECLEAVVKWNMRQELQSGELEVGN